MEEKQKDYVSIKINPLKNPKQTNKNPTYDHIFTSFSEYLTFSYENQSETQRKLLKIF